MRITRNETVVIVLMAAAGCALWIWPVMTQIGSVPSWSGAEYTDLLVSHYPNSVMVHSSLADYHQVPLWNPVILGGTPANADPLVGLWYPLRWLSFLIPAIWTFNLLVWGHLILAGVGVYRLAVLEGASRRSAMVAGLLFGGLPKLAAHLALGHIDLLFAISWTPWALIALRECVNRTGTSQPILLPAVKLGLVGGVIFLADPRWLIPFVLLAIAYAAPYSWVYMREKGVSHKFVSRVGGSFIVSAVTALLTAAPLALPLLQYTSLSTRRYLTSGDLSLFALPPMRIVGLALPFMDVPEWMTYLGLALVMLVLAGVMLGSRLARRWALIGAFFLLLGLGHATPIYSLISALPGVGLLRVPARYLVLLGLAASVGGAHALDALSDLSQPTDLRKRLNLTVAGLVAASIVLALVVFGGRDDGLVQLLQVTVSGSAAFVLILARARLGAAGRYYPALWLAIIGLDFIWMNSTVLEPRRTDLQADPAWMASIEVGSWGERRFFSPSYSLGQDVAARHQLEMVDGVHPLQLSAYFNYLAQATGYDPDQYSVTLPPFPGGDPSSPWNANLDAQRLGVLNVKYVLSAYPLANQDLDLLSDQSAYLYENVLYRPRAWVETSQASQPWRPVEQLSWSPNRIIVQAAGPGQLVLSEVDYPGWEAILDGHPIDTSTFDDLLRSVPLGEGDHRVEWVYRPVLTWIGLGGWCLLILSLLGIRLKWWS